MQSFSGRRLRASVLWPSVNRAWIWRVPLTSVRRCIASAAAARILFFLSESCSCHKKQNWSQSICPPQKTDDLHHIVHLITSARLHFTLAQSPMSLRPSYLSPFSSPPRAHPARARAQAPACQVLERLAASPHAAGHIAGPTSSCFEGERSAEDQTGDRRVAIHVGWRFAC